MYNTFIYSIYAGGPFILWPSASATAASACIVNVYTVKEGSAQYYNSYPATVTAVNQVEVRPQVAGYITGIFFKEGAVC